MLLWKLKSILPVCGTLALHVYVPASSLKKSFHVFSHFSYTIYFRFGPCLMMWWLLLNCQFKYLTAWLCGFDSVYSAVDVWTIFKHWLFDFPQKVESTWSLIIVVRVENLSKLELFKFNFGKKIRGKRVCAIYFKEKVANVHFTLWHF